MSDDLVNTIRAIVRDELRSVQLGDVGVVTSSFPHEAEDDAHNHECHVRLRESELELRRVPIATPHVGMVSAPEVGDLVLITYLGGDANRPVITGRLYADQRRPPVHQAGAWQVESPLGGATRIAIDEAGAVVLTAGDNVLTLEQDGTCSIEAVEDLKLAVKGNVELSCGDCTIDASGNIDLGKGGAAVITEGSHKCYYSGAPLVGSTTVKAKG